MCCDFVLSPSLPSIFHQSKSSGATERKRKHRFASQANLIQTTPTRAELEYSDGASTPFGKSS